MEWLITFIIGYICFCFLWRIIEGKWLFMSFFKKIFKQNNNYGEAINELNKVWKLKSKVEKLEKKLKLQNQITENQRQKAKSEIEWIMENK